MPNAVDHHRPQHHDEPLNPTDPVTITNLPFDASGNLIPSRLRPRDAGFGVANAYINPRTVQVQIRFQF